MIDEEFCFYKNSGKRMRTANLLEICAREFSVTYVAYAANDEEAAAAAAVWGPLGVETVPVRSPRVDKAGFGLLVTAVRTLGGRLPASVTAWRTGYFAEAVKDALSARPFDLIHCEITQMAWAVPFNSGVPTILNAHNVESVVWERLADVRRGPMKWVFRDQARKMRWFEAEILPRFDEVVCVSEVDRDRMRDRFGIGAALVLPNGVEAAMRPLPEVKGPPVLLYPGSLDWRPAQDGAAFLLHEILPRVRERCPEVQVAIVGKNPPQWLQRLCAETEGAACHPNVPEMEPYYRQARVVVVPLRVGSGSRLKILEALAYGRAVVSTSVGAEGLKLSHGRHLSVADGAGPFSAAVSELLLDKVKRAGLAGEGRKVIEERYQWEQIGAGMASAWRRTCGIDNKVATQ